MMLRLYAAATTLATPVLRRMLKQRAARGKEIPARLPEREGHTARLRPAGKLVWVHAASVGETMSVLPVLHALAKQTNILLTTGTVTSAKLAETRLPPGAIHQFVPLDVPAWTNRFLDHWQPDVAVFLENELWPNLLLGCDARNIPRLLLNARISTRSTNNWRYAPGTAGRLLGGFAAIHTQSAGDAKNFSALGAGHILQWGNLKFFAAPLPADATALAALRAQIPGPVWLAASTHPGEDAIIAEAHATLLAAHPLLVTIIAPRHPERGAEVAALCGNAPRRALGQAPEPGQIYVADTLGELGLFFRLCPFAFIGNSLAGFGGHNMVEPALLARPALTGPHNENFVEAAARMREAGALVEVADASSLAQAAGYWLDNPQAAQKAGQKAAACFGGAVQLPDRLAGLIMAAMP
ncbi:MAG: 3-deoxy-D-manno-octulosonic acid transferase [Acidocella sp.]|nr:3-deoxy-D-manno-octulosonic acid transferase [Acidocella sp.]